MSIAKHLFGLSVMILATTTIGGCKANAKTRETGDSNAVTTKSAKTAPTSAPPSWADKATGEGFKAWVESRPGGCDCEVTNFKKEGGVSVITWQVHRPGDNYYSGYVTTVGEHGGAGQKVSFDLTTKFKSCVVSEVGNKVIVSTRRVAQATSAMFRNGKYEVKPCRDEGVPPPSGMQEYFEKL